MGGTGGMSVVAGRVMPLPKGAWDSTTEYHILDIVSRSNASYMATGTSTGVDPAGSGGSAYWMQIVSSQTTFAGLSDVQLTNLANGQVSIYNSTSQKWENGAIPTPDISGKADKVTSATNGHLAGLDSNGNLTDSSIAATDVRTGTVGVANGGTGATTLTSGAVLIGNGTSAVQTRAITNNTATSGAVTGSTNIPTMNTLRFAMNRTTSVAAADTNYSTIMARGIYATTTDLTAGTTSLTNGTIALVYEN